jgi:hypothetical protein
LETSVSIRGVPARPFSRALLQRSRNSPVSAEIAPLSVKDARNPERISRAFFPAVSSRKSIVFMDRTRPECGKKPSVYYIPKYQFLQHQGMGASGRGPDAGLFHRRPRPGANPKKSLRAASLPAFFSPFLVIFHKFFLSALPFGNRARACGKQKYPRRLRKYFSIFAK